MANTNNPNLEGFNPDEVRTSINEIQKAYNNLYTAIGTRMQNEFINKMQDKWACKDAKDFFNGLKFDVDKIITESNKIFQSVADAMNSAAEHWASHTGSTWSNVAFSTNSTKMNVDNILENIGGVRGVDPEAKSVADKLTTIASDAENALTQARRAVDNCGFVGGNSAANLQSSLTKIKTDIHTVFNSLSNECKAEIKITADKYTNLEQSIASAFAGNK